MDGLQLAELVKLLKNGRLPCLREQQLPEEVSTSRTTIHWGKVSTDMLAKRKQRRILEARIRGVREEAPEGGGERWLPLTRIEGIALLEPDAEALRRIWRQCPSNAVTHLEAVGSAQVEALGAHLQRHTFGALRSLSLGGMRDRRDRRQVAIAGVLAALAQGRAPALEELTLHNWTPEMEGVAPLVQAMPQLVSLTLSQCDFAPAGFCALVDGLGALTGLRHLQLTLVNVDQAGIQHLAGALRTGGGLGRLESLELPLYEEKRTRDHLDPIMHALVGGAPCAGVLKSLACGLSDAGMGAFIVGLRDGRFPKLELLGMGNLTVDALRDFVDALVAMAGEQAPAFLANVKLQSRQGSTQLTLAVCMEHFAAAFEADALLLLTELYMEVYSDKTTKEGLERVCGLWRAAGDKVKLEVLRTTVHKLGNHAMSVFLDAIADPGFCPYLRAVPYAGDDKSIIDVAASLAERRRKWNRLAQAPAPVPPAPAQAAAAAGGAGVGAGAADDDDDVEIVGIVEPPAEAAAGGAGVVHVPANVWEEMLAEMQAIRAQLQQQQQQQGGGGV
jgi:hypothetical protein